MTDTARIRVQRSPEQLASDLAELSTVDWPTVWAGYRTVPEEWTAGLGWRLRSREFEGPYDVELPGGAHFSAYTGPADRGVEQLQTVLWQAVATTAEDNRAVLNAVEAAWSAYLHAAEGVLGPPGRRIDWEDEPRPDGNGWPDPSAARIEHAAYRLAEWTAPDRSILLYVNAGFGTPQAVGPGSALVRLVARPAAMS